MEESTNERRCLPAVCAAAQALVARLGLHMLAAGQGVAELCGSQLQEGGVGCELGAIV